MARARDILVTTSSSLDKIDVKSYLYPISAHVVAGTNLFSDFLASFSDVFGGRSNTYQKQLASLYSEAIESLRLTAQEVGANCIIGLKVDLDEISGKGKSMFMVTAIGTAVIIDNTPTKSEVDNFSIKFTEARLREIKTLQHKRKIIKEAQAGTLKLDSETWGFIISNQVSEVYEFLVSQLKYHLHRISDDFSNIYNGIVNYLDVLSDEMKTKLVYTSIINEENSEFALRLCEFVEMFNLLNFDYVNQILNSEEIAKQKLALKLLTFDKPAYKREDVDKLTNFVSFIRDRFPEKGTYSSKKSLLSSKEKEVWICTCNTTNELGTLCKNCFNDIYGFTSKEISPPQVILILEEKVNLISELI